MLIPNKHSHPDETVVAVAMVVLKELRRHHILTFTQLKLAAAKRSTGVEYLFTPALGLLHILGLVEYLLTIDSFEYKGPR